jgi:dipeptidyl aminopeptidase/acylaminoacyl peptidase
MMPILISIYYDQFIIENSIMTRAILLFIVFYISGFNASAQRHPIDTSVFQNWPAITRYPPPEITSDNRYLIYTLTNEPKASMTLVIKDIKSGLEKKIVQATNAHFSIDNRYIFYTLQDTLYICSVQLKVIKKKTIDPGTLKICFAGGHQVLIYKLRESNEFVIEDLNSGHISSLTDVENIWSQDVGNNIYITRKASGSGDTVHILEKLDMLNGKTTTLWKGDKIQSIIFNKDSTRLAFISTPDSSDAVSDKMIMINTTDLSSRNLLNEVKEDLDAKYQITDVLGFNNEGNGIVFTIESRINDNMQPNENEVKVWSSHDSHFPEINTPSQLTACYNVDTKKLVILNPEGGNVSMRFNELCDTIVYISISKGEGSERNWNPRSHIIEYQVSTRSGKKDSLEVRFTSSPSGKYLIGEEKKSRDLIIYDPYTSKRINLNQLIKSDAKISYDDMELKLLKIEGWFAKDSGVILSDGFDIWKFSFINNEVINITGGLGYRKKYEFHIDFSELNDSKIESRGNDLILTAFDQENRYSGYYLANINGKKLAELNMGLYYYSPVYKKTVGFNKPNNNTEKLIFRCNAEESLNVYLTKDYKSFRRLTYNHPESKYIWLTNKLINFQSVDGKKSKALIYMPDNFDSTRKYPVIFNIYEKNSDDLNIYDAPWPCIGGMDIAWFVSHGYIVCLPDIHYVKGYPGESAYSYVIGLMNTLKKENWFDTAHLGLLGHSFGGFETAYIISHCTYFKAAYAGAAPVNLISLFGGLSSEGLPYAPIMEQGQLRIGATPWDNMHAYINNSPLLFIDKVETPVLLMNNEKDESVPNSQGLEFFFGLRRCGKTAWLLQYKNEGHLLTNYQNSVDFTCKLTDFFDYFLKGAKIGNWMR